MLGRGMHVTDMLQLDIPSRPCNPSVKSNKNILELCLLIHKLNVKSRVWKIGALVQLEKHIMCSDLKRCEEMQGVQDMVDNLGEGG